MSVGKDRLIVDGLVSSQSSSPKPKATGKRFLLFLLPKVSSREEDLSLPITDDGAGFA